MTRVNLFLIGVNKAGTSWLYHLLRRHPDVFMSDVKELYYFGDEQDGPDSLSAYHEHFPFDEEYRYYGEATVMYYREARVADEIHAYNPEAKVLAIVRDPIQRTLSQYRYHKQLGLIDENTDFDEALTVQPMLLRDSHYEETLPHFADRFGPDQFTVVSLEEGREAPERLWKDLLTFLDIAEVPLPDRTSSPENPTGSAAFRRLYRMTIRPLKKQAPGVYERMLQSTLVRQIKLGLIRLLGTADASPISDEVEGHLRDEFAPTYEYLQELGFTIYPTS